MPDRYRCHVEQAIVRPPKRDTLDALVRKMFERRHHRRIAGQEKAWLEMELVQALREASRVYRDDFSTKTEGPLPFALGYFRVRDGHLELVSDEVPANVAPKVLVHLFSEFVEPGARFCFQWGKEEERWAVRDVGKVEVLGPGGDQPSDWDDSAGVSS